MAVASTIIIKLKKRLRQGKNVGGMSFMPDRSAILKDLRA